MTAEDLAVYLRADPTAVAGELDHLFVNSKVECAPDSGPLYRTVQKEQLG